VALCENLCELCGKKYLNTENTKKALRTTKRKNEKALWRSVKTSVNSVVKKNQTQRAQRRH
jgi:ribosomal protein L28